MCHSGSWLSVALALLLGVAVANAPLHASTDRGQNAPMNALSRVSVESSTDFDPQAAKVANLKDQLEKGLRVRRPEEFAYVGYIVGLVESDDLPLQLVLETFQWARKQDGHYPFPYFQRAIRIRAARAGIEID